MLNNTHTSYLDSQPFSYLPLLSSFGHHIASLDSLVVFVWVAASISVVLAFAVVLLSVDLQLNFVLRPGLWSSKINNIVR
jgi:hypothetical protein